MITEKQKIKNSIKYRRKLLKLSYNILEIIKDRKDIHVIESLIDTQEKALLALETRLARLGVLAEKGRF